MSTNTITNRLGLWKVSIFAFLFVLVKTTTVHAILPPDCTGNFYVSNFSSNMIAVYNPSGAYLRSFTTPGISGARGVVFAPNDRIYLASQFTNEIFVFDLNEQFITKFTSIQFDGPTGMSISPSNELYVCSFNNDQVVVFDLNGNMLRTFTGGNLNGANCVTFDSHENIYVSSALTATIIKFDPNENFVSSFTGGGLSSPMSIARNTDDILYVSGGGSHNIVKFDTSGNYLGMITHPDLTGPQGVVFDEYGHLFSSSFFQDHVVEFDENEMYVQTITDGGLSVPRSMAFVPQAMPCVCTPPDITSFHVDNCSSPPNIVSWAPVSGATAYGFHGEYNNGNKQLNRTLTGPGFTVGGNVPNGFPVEIQLRTQCMDGSWSAWTPLSPYTISCPLMVPDAGIFNQVTIENDTFSKEGSVFPNPANDLVYLKSGGMDQYKDIDISVYNISGKQMVTLQTIPGSTIPINIKRWERGHYLMVIKQGDHVVTKRFVKM